MGRLLEIARVALTEAEARPASVADPELCQTDQLPVSDPYAERVRGALGQLKAPDYPTCMVPWLGMTRPDLYAELTSHLPDEIQLLWSERAPLEQFEAVLARLVTLHRRCCELYCAKPRRVRQSTRARRPNQ